MKRPPISRTAKTFVSPRGVGTTTAECPRKKRALSGGFGTQGFSREQGPQVLALTSKKAGKRKWKVEGYNIPAENDSGGGQPGGSGGGQGQPGTLYAYVYCVKKSMRLKTVKRTVDLPPNPGDSPGEARSVDVRCPRKSTVMSAGFDGNLVLAAEARAGGAISSTRVGRRAWHTEAVNISDSGTSKLTAYAYCKKKKKKRHG